MNLIISNLIKSSYKEITSEQFNELFPENYIPADEHVVFMTGDPECNEDKLRILMKDSIVELISIKTFESDYLDSFYFIADENTTKLNYIDLFISQEEAR